MPSSLRSVIAREVIKNRVRDATHRFFSPVTLWVLVTVVTAVLVGLLFFFFYVRRREEEGESRPEKTAFSSSSSVSSSKSSEKKKKNKKRERGKQTPPPPPEVIQSLRTLCDRVEAECLGGGAEADDGGVGDALLAMGEIYRTGSFPRFAPNDESAEKCFGTCARRFGGRIAAMGQMKLVECLRSPVADVDRTGSVLPGKYARRAIARCDTTATFASSSSRPRMPAAAAAPTVGEENDTTIEQLLTMTRGGAEEEEEHALAAFLTATNTTEPVEVVAAPRVDAQNVHDHGVTSAVSTNLRSMPSSRRPGAAVDQVARGLRGCRGLSEEDKENALRVLYDLNGRDVHSTYGVTEQEALASVWAGIQASPYREDLVETLGKQLASGVEHGCVVCSSGKIARIVGTLDGVHNDATARPMDVVRQEIAGMAIVVRNEVEAQYGDGSDEGEQEMRERLKRRAHEEYVRRLGMNEVLVTPLVEEFCAGF